MSEARRRIRAGLAVCCTVLVTSAGACQRGRDEPIPEPAELDAGSFPEGSTSQGLDVVYVGRERPDCDEILLLQADGSAHHTATCGGGADALDALLADRATWIGETTGDYAYRDGRLWIRVVAWDPITESFVLGDWAFRYCGGELRDIPPDDSFRVPFEYRAVEGAGPPDAADHAC